MSNFLQEFLSKADESLKGGSRSLGTGLKVKVDLGYYVFVDRDNQHFAVGNGGAALDAAHTEAKGFLAKHGNAREDWRVKLAVRITEYEGTERTDTQYPLLKDRETIISARQTQDLFSDSTEKVYITDFGWTNFAEKTLNNPDSGFREDMLGKDVWALVKSIPHPKYDANDPETHNKMTGYDGNIYDDDGLIVGTEFKTRWFKYLEKVFATEAELLEHLAALGVESDDAKPAMGSDDYGILPPQAWIDVGMTEEDWPENVANVVAQLILPVLNPAREKADGKPAPVAKKIMEEAREQAVAQIQADWVGTGMDEVAGELFDAVTAVEPPF
jgi:hypothetical protein